MSAPLTRNEWLQSYVAAGMSITESAKHAGLNRSQFWHMVRASGVTGFVDGREGNYAAVKQDVVDAMSALHARGFTPKQIAENLGMSSAAVCNMNRRNGIWPVRNRRPSAPKTDAPMATTWLTRPKGSQNTARASQ